MKVKGFTLIELLAVIVILAIIALIAVPIILNIVGNSKKSSVLRSRELYLKAVETAIARENLNSQFNPTKCIIKNDGNLTCDEDKTLTIQVNGSKPTSGTITLEKGKIIQVEDMTLTEFELEKKPGEKLKIKETISTEEPIELNAPIYSIDITERAPKKIVTITYPEINGKNLIYEYSIDKGNTWKQAVQSQQVIFTSAGTVIARVSNGSNTVTGKSYSVVNVGEVLNPHGTYLMKSSLVNSAETTFLGGNLNRSTVESITVVDSKDVPSNAIGSWDVSEKKDGSVIAWYTDIDNNNLYELYIGGEGGVKANPDSSYLFNKFINATSIDLSSFDTSNVTQMKSMFYQCTKLANLNLDSFDTYKVTNMDTLFNECNSLVTININNFDTSNVTTMYYMFSGCRILTDIDLSKFNTNKVTNMSGMFCSCRGLTNLDLSNFNTVNVTNMRSMFSECRNLTNIDISSFDVSNAVDISWMFDSCYALTNLDLSKFNTAKVTDMSRMFQNCKSLIALDLSHFDTRNITDMNGMFCNCEKLTNLNISNFVTTNTINMNAMFSGCRVLTELDLSSFDMNSVSNVSNMFNSCTNLISLDIRKADFTNVTNYNNMFYDAYELTTVYVKDETAKAFVDNIKPGVAVIAV